MGYVPGQTETYRLAEASCRDVSLCLVAGKPTGTMGYVPGQIETYRMAEASCRDVSLCLVAGKPTGTMGYVAIQIETYQMAEASCRDVSCGRKTDRDHGLCPRADRDVRLVEAHCVLCLVAGKPTGSMGYVPRQIDG